MRISFVIPAYNEEAYLPACLDAMLREIAARGAETHDEFEIIIVDNNSNDRTPEIAAEYATAHPFIRLIREPKRGANRARETGFGASHGDLVAFLDADTRMPEGWLSRAKQEFARDPRLVCLSGPFIYYDLPLAIRAFVRIFYGISYFVYLINNFILRNTSVIQGGSEVVRRDALRHVGGHNVDITFYGDDADLAQRLSKVGRVKFSFKFPILSSGRRLAKEGAFTMGLRYALNYFWVTFFKRPFTMTSKEIRFKDGSTSYRPERRANELAVAIVVLTTLLLIAAGALWLLLIVWLKIW